MPRERTLKVADIKREPDRQLLYGQRRGLNSYHVIAGLNDRVKIGDEVRYEPYGINFGWFLGIVIESK